MRVLNLVTNEESRFFKQQVETLESRGIESRTVSVPGTRVRTDDESSSRSVLDYLRFYPPVLTSSFGDYDLLHANYGLTAPAALAQPNLPVVLSLWGSDLMGEYGWLSKWCAKFADAVVVMSPEMAAELDCDTYVVPHGVDLERFAPEPQRDARERVGWRHDAHHVLFPYPETREVKNYPRAERVVEAVREQFSGRLELHTLFGVPHRGMPAYYNAADALLLTSRREGSPNSVKEALACNLPVVSTDVGDVGERLAGVDLSTVARTDEALVDGLLRVLRAGRRSNGRQRAREVSLERMGEQLEGIYRRVVEDGSADVSQPVTVGR
ncbi:MULTISPECIES: glycosyltransferase family 4 protein [Salinibaculum]|uniref:glycosyltransferase family 4 protein n=1 Tax=Salinibaculum TaxID=2732368 RepID=UPI0030D181AB